MFGYDTIEEASQAVDVYMSNLVASLYRRGIFGSDIVKNKREIKSIKKIPVRCNIRIMINKDLTFVPCCKVILRQNSVNWSMELDIEKLSEEVVRSLCRYVDQEIEKNNPLYSCICW